MSERAITSTDNEANDPAAPPSEQLAKWGNLIVYFIVPTLIALVIASVKPARTASWPQEYALAYWLLSVHGGLLVKDVCTRFAAWVLKRRELSLLTILLIGSAISLPPHFFMMRTLISGFYVEMGMTAAPSMLPSFNLYHVFDNAAIGVVFWVFLNFGYVYVLGIQRFGYRVPSYFASSVGQTATAAVAADAGSPPFLRRVDRPIGDLYALQAEQHYVRVIGTLGDSLIRYRMSDAVDEAEMVFDGLKIHRSWWVALAAVERVEGDSRNRRVILKNGLEIPVSRTFQGGLNRKLR